MEHRRLKNALHASLVLILLFLVQAADAGNYSQLSERSLVKVTAPDVTLQSGTVGTNTIYVNGTSGSSSFTSYSTYNPSSYNIITGTYTSGTVPGSLQSVDANYFVNTAAGNATSTTNYNPNGYNLVSYSTAYSGGIGNLAANDSSYFSIKSYPSQLSSTSLSLAFGAYRSTSGSGVNFPSTRFWDGSSWGGESQLSTAGSPIRWVRTVTSTVAASTGQVARFNETTVVTLADDGFLDAYVYNGTSWSTTSNIANVGTTVNAYRSFGVAYENSTGRVLLVYSLPGGNHRIGYKIWDGSSWSAETTFNLEAATAGDVYWVETASKPGSTATEILIATISSTLRIHGVVWSGSALGNVKVLSTNAAIATKLDLGVAYEQTSGYGTIAYGDTNDAKSFQWSGSAWDASATTVWLNKTPNWCTLKADPASGSDKLFLMCITSNSNLKPAEWSGSAWTELASQENTVDEATATRSADFAWEPTGSKGLLVWGAGAGTITYETYTYPGTFGAKQTPAMGTNKHAWVQLRTNPRSPSGDIKILGMVQEDTSFNIGAVKWDGTTFTIIGASTFTSSSGTISYETLSLAFRRFGNPTQYTSEIEFTGSSNTASWTQLKWSLDSAWDTASMAVTVQLFNYTSGTYPSSGSGYDSYTSSATANTDQGRTQTITSGPSTFRDGSGNWKLKVKGVKSTGTMFMFKADWVEFQPGYYNQYAAQTVFTFTGISSSTPISLNFTTVSTFDTGSVSVTIQLYNYTGASYVTSGQGYTTYTSLSTPADETKVLSITANPSQYVSGAQARISINSVKSTTSPFQQKTNLMVLNHFPENAYGYFPSATYPSGYNVVTGSYSTGTVPGSVNAVDSNYFTTLSSGQGVLATKSSSSTASLPMSQQRLFRNTRGQQAYYLFYRSTVSTVDKCWYAYSTDGKTWTTDQDTGLSANFVSCSVIFREDASNSRTIIYFTASQVQSTAGTGRDIVFRIGSVPDAAVSITWLAAVQTVRSSGSSENLAYPAVARAADAYVHIIAAWTSNPGGTSNDFQGFVACSSGTTDPTSNPTWTCSNRTVTTLTNTDSIGYMPHALASITGHDVLIIQGNCRGTETLPCAASDTLERTHFLDWDGSTQTFTSATSTLSIGGPADERSATVNATSGRVHYFYEDTGSVIVSRYIDSAYSTWSSSTTVFSGAADGLHMTITVSGSVKKLFAFYVKNSNGDVYSKNATDSQSWGAEQLEYTNATVAGRWVSTPGILDSSIFATLPVVWVQQAATPEIWYVTHDLVTPPTAATEFTFSVPTSSPVQLNFTIVHQYDRGSLAVKIQVYNYTGASYPSSGQGYLAYTSSSTPNTDETKSLTVTTSPQQYSSGGQVKIKITGSLGAISIQKTNFARLYYYVQSLSYLLKITNQGTSSYNIRLNSVGLTQGGIGRLANFTSWFESGTVQLQVLSGSFTTQTGSLYSLAASSTAYVLVRVTSNNVGVSTIDCYLQVYIPGTTSHTDYRVTFRIT